MNLTEAAKKYLSKDISVIATGSDKRAIFPWKQYQERLITTDELRSQFSSPKAAGIAIICGAISGRLEVIDVDTKYDITGSLFNDLMLCIRDLSEELADRLLVIQTKSGGYHIYYRCEATSGNMKLAQRPATEEEVKANPNEKVLVLIETRGEGGYVIAPPTPGYKKQSGDEIPTLTPAEREAVLEICRSFNQYVIEQPKPIAARQHTEGFARTPWEDYNARGIDHMLNTLQAHGWTVVGQKKDKVIFKRPGNTESKTSGDYSHKHNLFTVFTTSSEFDPLKGYKPAAVYAMLEHRGDWKAAARALMGLGYGEKKQSYGGSIEKELFQKKQEGMDPAAMIVLLQNKYEKTEGEAADIVSNLEKQWGQKLCEFWDVDKNKRIQINRGRFIDFLHDVGGFGLYFYDKNSKIYRIVRVSDGFAEESSTEQMKKFILDYIQGLPDTFDGGITPEELREVIVKQYNTLFNEGFLEFLPALQLNFLKDSVTTSYYPFINGVVVVTENGCALMDYKAINGVIWRNQVTDFQITIDPAFDPTMCEYFRFLQKISGDETERILYCTTLIGYMLHRYKDPSKPYAMVLAEETESDKDGGGTGKGIFIKALAYLLRTVKLDGKNFKTDKSFSMQRVNLDTQLIVVEDCDKGIDFEKFNSQITEGSTVEKKNKDELFIDYKDSPKFAFTTNYTLNIKGNHGRRRTKVFEFAPFFGPDNTPQSHFGHLLFEDWDQDEWNRFYNLMFFCLYQYLAAGIREVKSSEKIKRKGIKLSFGDEFLEWWDGYISNGCADWKPFKDMYHGFLNLNGYEKKEYSQKRFKKALESSGETFNYRVVTQRNWSAGGQHEVRAEPIK